MKSRREMFALDSAPNTFDEANARLFERMCREDGIDPARGVSPALAAILRAVAPVPANDEEAA